MRTPRIAIITFPGTNGDTENLRAFWRCGFEAFVFRWNDSLEKLTNVDGYFIGAGFSYEDRGRSGMVAARDVLFQFLHEEAEKGKVVIGNCNGAQVLVESGLIPFGDGLRMSLARNAIRRSGSGWDLGSEEWYAPGFLNEWIWITRTCKRDRCATSNLVDATGSPYDEAMHIPMAHGEGRFVTKDPNLVAELEKNDQIAFRYCDEDGNISEDPSVTLNGSTNAIAGICNPAGNVVALMPHPERTQNGDPYFFSIRQWIERRKDEQQAERENVPLTSTLKTDQISVRKQRSVEIFIDTIIVNNEERTVEQAARRVVPSLRLKQYRYIASEGKSPEVLLTMIALFNPHKELAYVRKGKTWLQWDSAIKELKTSRSPLTGKVLLRRDEPDTGTGSLGHGSETGICYDISGIDEQNLCSKSLQEIFANPHASILERIYH